MGREGGASLVTDANDLWIFAYGSLLWDPGFQPAESARARLMGWRRSFCMWSHRFRGTEEAPGLVLALDADPVACCEGLVLRVDKAQEDEVMSALRARELITGAYEELVLPVALEDGRRVEAVVYVIRRDHHQYACVDAETQAQTIARAHGQRGPNIDYLTRTAAQLARHGIRDPEIEALLAQARALGP
jgi:glutathione-specific gamma-glutamylcyclotransferase